MSPRYVLALTATRGRQAKLLANAAERLGLELVAFEQAQDATQWVDRNDPHAVVLDLRTLGIGEVCNKVRSRRQLSRVPVIALTPQLTDNQTARLLANGVDEVLPFDSPRALLLRLERLPVGPLQCVQPKGWAIVAEDDSHRCDIFGRVFTNAGYDVKYAVDERSVLYYQREHAAQVVLFSPALADPLTIIKEARQQGSQALWVVTASGAELSALQHQLAELSNVEVIPRDAPPTDALFLANELRERSSIQRRQDERLLYGTQVRFKVAGEVEDDYGFSYNVSRAGLFVRTLAPPVSDRVWLQVRPPESREWVCLAGEVAWRRAFHSDQVAATPAGFGVRFQEGLGDGMQAWQRAVERLAEPSVRQASRGLSSLVSEILEAEGVRAVTMEAPFVGSIPGWGEETSDPSTLDGLVTHGPQSESGELAEPARDSEVEAKPPPLPAAEEASEAPLARSGGQPPPLPVRAVASPVKAPRGRRGTWVAVAAGVVCLVAGGVWWSSPSGESLEASRLEPSRGAVATRPPSPASSATPVPSSARPTLAAAEKSAAAPVSDSPTDDDTDLRANQAGLRVLSAEELLVYVQGVKKGETHQRLIVPCGFKYVRLRASESGPWRSEGLPSKLPCGVTTTLDIRATPVE